MKFAEKLEEMGVEFGKEDYRMLSFTTDKKIMVRMEKCSPLKELINTVCQELAEQIEDTIIEGGARHDIEYMGFSNLQLNVQYKNEDENDSVFIEPDIWESIS